MEEFPERKGRRGEENKVLYLAVKGSSRGSELESEVLLVCESEGLGTTAPAWGESGELGRASRCVEATERAAETQHENKTTDRNTKKGNNRKIHFDSSSD